MKDNAPRRRLAFISTVFLLPADAGGKIRTGNVLRGMKGQAFDITLVMPATAEQLQTHSAELQALCDRVRPWQPAPARPRWTRVLDLLHPLPANVAHDATAAARSAVADLLAQEAFDVVVYDFVHAAVLQPAQPRGTAGPRTVCFTHNVEAEIFQRHASTASGPLMRRVWAAQARKMRRFEGDTLRRFDAVVAVSERDGQQFQKAYGLCAPQTIPTGVDLDFFAWQAPPAPSTAQPPTAVFTGSMDWAANIDGVRFFLAEVWPQVLARRPDARFVVVGRHPPAALLREAAGVPGVHFTGFVDDVRTHVHPAQAFVIPLRVGGGTRIKAFEAMAMGCPVVSTAVGIEGLDVAAGTHYLLADSAPALAAAVLRLFEETPLRESLAVDARAQVERHFGHMVAARAFEQICLRTLAGPSSAMNAVPARA